MLSNGFVTQFPTGNVSDVKNGEFFRSSLYAVLLQILFDRIASDLDVSNRFSQYKLIVVGVVIDDDNDLVIRCE